MNLPCYGMSSGEALALLHTIGKISFWRCCLQSCCHVGLCVLCVNHQQQEGAAAVQVEVVTCV